MDSLTRTLFHLSPAGAMLLRPLYQAQELVDFAYEQLNLAAQQMLRLPAQPTESFLQRYPMAVESGVFAFYRDTFLAGQPNFYGVDYRYDGLDAYYQLAAHRDGEYLVVSFTDTIDRRQGDMATALQRSYQLEQEARAETETQRHQLSQLNQELEGRVLARTQEFHLLTDALPVLIGYLDCERRYQFVNEAYRAWFQQDPTSLLGQPVRQVVGEAAYAVASSYMDRALAGERVDFKATMPYHSDGVRHVRTSFIPNVRAGKVVGFYSLMLDITEEVTARQLADDLNQELATINEELRLSNEEMIQTNSQLTRTNADLDTFVYTASHDLKAPITNIEGLVDALRYELAAPQLDLAASQHLLNLMTDSIARFQKTIGYLTTITQTQPVGTVWQSQEHIELAGLLEDVCLDLQPSIAVAQAQVTIDVAACPTMWASPKDVRSIVFNLLSNAIKYRAPDRVPVVQIRVNCFAQQVFITVQDNGLGLSPAQQLRLFQLFRRQHTHVEGAGVGLYAIKRLIENAGGTITVESTEGVGSTFTVALPLRA